MEAHSPPFGRELLAAFVIIFGSASLLAGVGILFLLPFFTSPGEAVSYIAVLLIADLAVVSPFAVLFLRSRLVTPVTELVADVSRVAEGDYAHRVREMPSRELQAIRNRVNAMADRLIHDQDLLARNIESLDETNRELLEARDQVVRSARMASVGTLAAGIAHEVGNPLSAVLGYADLATRRIEREGGDVALLEGIREEAERIDAIVRGLLDYVRPKHAEPEPVHPADVVSRVRALLENQGQLDAIDHRWSLDDEDVPVVVVEPHRLEQVLVNVLLNAIQAMAAHGATELRVGLGSEPGHTQRLPARREQDPPGINYMHRRRVSGGIASPDPLLTAARVATIRIEDSGPGIPEEDIERIFDPFFTTKEPGRGTGLGLSICAQLVEGMGGRIDARNAGEGRGAVFTIRLPGAQIDPADGGAEP